MEANCICTVFFHHHYELHETKRTSWFMCSTLGSTCLRVILSVTPSIHARSHPRAASTLRASVIVAA